MSNNNVKHAINSIWGAVVILATIATLVAFLISLTPRLVVEKPNIPMVQDDPFSTQMDVVNAGPIPLTDVRIQLIVKKLLTPNIVIYNSTFVVVGPRKINLSTDERYTVSLESYISGLTEANEAEIAIQYSYRPWILPWRKKGVAHYVMYIQPRSRQRYWVRVPPNK